ncbi:cytochrome b [Fluoribacter dumoffii]|uniref:Cytochrome b561 homolog 2 n=1 Tax=Fluoribacter dumoffii TaxID=463 RepID=A0A377GA59_9GAMM|nr:cytochrome b [Fluoribacter dumoffii]KTC88807.1 cytochrome b561 family protein [Fluoribacter dumoffii NY 23]MCW8385897.1 cytochrome b [Fluoribacter dumoffii]MCW8418951.1 cytochrome b [Fluoribacter dumoffii]MCW8453205.1 cytochrome b [Fluoribacter dumoffii]MCW8459574.1 cytochrome b [Fluoribacter dumoffii]
MLRNTMNRFGSITKVLHWLIFILITAQYYLVWSLGDNSPLTPLYIMLHKSIGVTILILGILFLIWHLINIKPLPPKSQPRWQYVLSKIVHHTLFMLIILMPIVGYLLTCADGKPINFFGLFTLPCLVEANEQLGNVMFATHEKLAFVILLFVGIHALAALYHHFIHKDFVLRRMLPFTSKE